MLVHQWYRDHGMGLGGIFVFLNTFVFFFRSLALVFQKSPTRNKEATRFTLSGDRARFFRNRVETLVFLTLWCMESMGAIVRAQKGGGHRKRAEHWVHSACSMRNECSPFLRPKVFSLFRLQGWLVGFLFFESSPSLTFPSRTETVSLLVARTEGKSEPPVPWKTGRVDGRRLHFQLRLCGIDKCRRNRSTASLRETLLWSTKDSGKRQELWKQWPSIRAKFIKKHSVRLLCAS